MMMFETLKNYVDQMAVFGPEYQRWSDWFRAEGKYWGVTMDEESTGFHLGYLWRAEIKQCFYNAIMVATSHDDAQYYEGYVCSDELPIPLHHAWIVNGRGEVVDPTLAALWRKTGADRRYHYYGVKLPTEFVLKRVLDRGGWADEMIFRFFEERVDEKSPGSV